MGRKESTLPEKTVSMKLTQAPGISEQVTENTVKLIKCNKFMDNEIMQNPISIPSECLKRVKQCGTPWKSAGLFKSFSVGAGGSMEPLTEHHIRWIYPVPHFIQKSLLPLYIKKNYLLKK